mmetsp:Transcript_825/g.1484  ORF Transcript_825/g.1484 Transcript_825/m.1484 type:complete len:81 (+) Transcript_825:2191-2433(+)
MMTALDATSNLSLSVKSKIFQQRNQSHLLSTSPLNNNEFTISKDVDERARADTQLRPDKVEDASNRANQNEQADFQIIDE